MFLFIFVKKPCMQVILDHQQIQQKIKRLAHEIIENSFEEQKILIGGIKGNGSILANEIIQEIQKNSTQRIDTFEITVDKEEPWKSDVQISVAGDAIKGAYVVLVDDVLNSGKTMQYALVKLLEHPTIALKTVSLIDRSHRRYPIKADFVGLSLSTTLKEHIEVDFEPNNFSAKIH